MGGTTITKACSQAMRVVPEPQANPDWDNQAQQIRFQARQNQRLHNQVVNQAQRLRTLVERIRERRAIRRLDGQAMEARMHALNQQIAALLQQENPMDMDED